MSSEAQVSMMWCLLGGAGFWFLWCLSEFLDFFRIFEICWQFLSVVNVEIWIFFLWICGWLPDMESAFKVVLDYELFDPGFIGKGALVLAESFAAWSSQDETDVHLLKRSWQKSTMWRRNWLLLIIWSCQWVSRWENGGWKDELSDIFRLFEVPRFCVLPVRFDAHGESGISNSMNMLSFLMHHMS